MPANRAADTPHILLGSDAFQFARQAEQARTVDADCWQAVSVSTDFSEICQDRPCAFRLPTSSTSSVTATAYPPILEPVRERALLSRITQRRRRRSRDRPPRTQLRAAHDLLRVTTSRWSSANRVSSKTKTKAMRGSSNRRCPRSADMEIWSVTRASSPHAETETAFNLPPGARTATRWCNDSQLIFTKPLNGLSGPNPIGSSDPMHGDAQGPARRTCLADERPLDGRKPKAK